MTRLTDNVTFEPLRSDNVTVKRTPTSTDDPRFPTVDFGTLGNDQAIRERDNVGGKAEHTIYTQLGGTLGVRWEFWDKKSMIVTPASKLLLEREEGK